MQVIAYPLTVSNNKKETFSRAEILISGEAKACEQTEFSGLNEYFECAFNEE